MKVTGLRASREYRLEFISLQRHMENVAPRDENDVSRSLYLSFSLSLFPLFKNDRDDEEMADRRLRYGAISGDERALISRQFRFARSRIYLARGPSSTYVFVPTCELRIPASVISCQRTDHR